MHLMIELLATEGARSCTRARVSAVRRKSAENWRSLECAAQSRAILMLLAITTLVELRWNIGSASTTRRDGRPLSAPHSRQSRRSAARKMSVTARVRRRKQDPAFDYDDDIDDNAKKKRHSFQRTPELLVPPRPPPDLLSAVGFALPGEARAAAVAEGLELVPSSNATGFKGVSEHYGKYTTKVREDRKTRYLGIFATPEEAALCYARHIGAAQAAAEAAEARGEGQQPLTAAEAIAAAAAEGLALVPSSNATRLATPCEGPNRTEAP